ncbi:MAG TPA: 4-hydroxy-3-methylbut-2-enyl diphosphate reductase [Gemmatimonadota bacterium]|nr:4-hydroxy-3-methylbut-2-enyl diphosphate reductase [Gemmatimonadota bacterium]
MAVPSFTPMNDLIGEDQLYYRKGFGLKDEVSSELSEAYHSDLVNRIVAEGHRLEVGDVAIRLAREFGNCYGVDRAVQYAYETRRRFPDRRIFLTGELIHNPHVNRDMVAKGIGFLTGRYAGETGFDTLRPDDVVLLPAFGAPTDEMRRLKETGCVLVDTTCGSVLLVWKTVERFAREGYTAIIHGKYYHEETRATASRALEHPGGAYLIVRDLEETALVTAFIRQGDAAADTEVDVLARRFADAASPGFDWRRDLVRVGVANQTTMLMRETEAVAEEFRKAMLVRYGEAALEDHFRALDTICSATQERQDAVVELLADPPGLMIVLGGYNSSNTNNLARICAQVVPTFHIDDPSCIEGPEAIRHKPVDRNEEVLEAGWLPEGPVEIGLTAGASTPNNKTGETIERVLACRNMAVPIGS